MWESSECLTTALVNFQGGNLISQKPHGRFCFRAQRLLPMHLTVASELCPVRFAAWHQYSHAIRRPDLLHWKNHLNESTKLTVGDAINCLNHNLSWFPVYVFFLSLGLCFPLCPTYSLRFLWSTRWTCKSLCPLSLLLYWKRTRRKSFGKTKVMFLESWKSLIKYLT